jgi:(1->4)-alpha-D-glucan 1-alpha-D-glucosylmutase
MAKGSEDTAFYRYHRLVSLNDVGSTPDQLGVSVAAFHAHNQNRLQSWPATMLTTSTHDTKRSEDVRARINVLSEIPREWRAALTRWSRQHRKRKSIVDGQEVPDRNDEYLLYQTLLGVWPLTPMNAEDYAVFKQRMQDYMHKATKEAKVTTSWINPNQAYDQALHEFVSRVLDDFLGRDDFQRLREKVAQAGMINALTQTVLKLTVPGVPDIYQGTELWDFSLVDPDNRRPVDYAHRQRLLKSLQDQITAAGADLTDVAHDLLDHRIDGRIKLYVMHRLLWYRRAHPELFRLGSYTPIESGGDKAQHLCAFVRQHERNILLVIAPRLVSRLLPDSVTPPLGIEVWGDTRLVLPGREGNQHYRNLFTGETLIATRTNETAELALGTILAHFPVAVLTVEG